MKNIAIIWALSVLSIWAESVNVKSLFGGNPAAAGTYTKQEGGEFTKPGFIFVNLGGGAWSLGLSSPFTLLENSASDGDDSSPATSTWTKYLVTEIKSPGKLPVGGGSSSAVTTPGSLNPVSPGVPAKPENYLGTFAQPLSSGQRAQVLENIFGSNSPSFIDQQVFFDDFERPDETSIQGDLLSPGPTGHYLRQIGSGLGDGNQLVAISDGRLVLPKGGNIYFTPSVTPSTSGAVLPLDLLPRHIGAVVSFHPSSSPGPGNSLFAFLTTSANGVPASPMVHATFLKSNIGIESWTHNGLAPPNDANIIEGQASVVFPVAIPTDGRPVAVDLEFHLESETIYINVEGQPQVTGKFPNLADYLTGRLSFQITETKDISEGGTGRIHDSRYDAIYAYGEGASGPNYEKARALTLRAKGTSLPPLSTDAADEPVVKEFAAIQNNATLAADVDQVRIKFGAAGWTSAFWVLNLPPIASVPLGHRIEFFDDGYAMDPANTSTRFIALGQNGATFVNENTAGGMRYYGGINNRFVLVKTGATEWTRLL